MSVTSDGPSPAEAAAHRRWLITLAITILFGGFGAVMAYLSYANSSKPTPSYRGRPASKAPSTAPSTAPTTPTVAPPAAEPSSGSDKGKGPKDK